MTPSCSSSAPIWREIADWLSFSVSPAWVKLPGIGYGLEDPQLVPVHASSPCLALRRRLGRRLLRGLRERAPPGRASHFSASSAAMQPVPAAVTAWRKILSCTSPAA